MLTTTRQWCWSAVVLLAFVVALPAQAQRNVTLTLNTATLPDTLDSMDEVQVRGAIDGTGNVMLPDGNVIDWNDNTTLKPQNDGGDNWSVSFQIPDNSELKFKFYTQLAEDDGIGGWEDGDDHVVDAGTGDVTLPLHFFNKTGGNLPYDQAPFESKQDSVGVWFRVFMCTSEGSDDGYNPNAPQTVAVRGDDLSGMGPLDWGTNKVVLSQESATDGQPGFDIWSGVAYFANTLSGMNQAHKFVFEDAGVVSWEDGTGDRPLTIPQSDSTVNWVYYGNTAPKADGCGATPVTGDVIFTVDLTPLESVGLFDKARGDSLQVVGSFNGWDWQDRAEPKGVMDPVPGQLLFESVQQMSLVVPNNVNYKYTIWFDSLEFHDALGFAPPGRIQDIGFGEDFQPIVFEEPLSTAGGNRVFTFDGSAENELPVARFNDVLDANIIPAGTSIDVTWTIDMTAALTPEVGGSNANDPFVPGTDKVLILAGGDLIWATTQGYPRRDDGTVWPADTTFSFTQVSGNVYEGTKTITGPTYSSVQYTYGYGTSQAAGQFFDETEGSFTGGRRRTRFIQPNPDGSWPATYSYPMESFIADGDKPVEMNPAVGVGVEPVDGELPQEISLSQNYPNPFNPSTTFQYTISESQQVDLFVYDIIGRRVRTLVSGLQPANTYRVSFDATDLASGTYFYRLETADKVITRTMVLLK